MAEGMVQHTNAVAPQYLENQLEILKMANDARNPPRVKYGVKSCSAGGFT